VCAYINLSLIPSWFNQPRQESNIFKVGRLSVIS